MKYFTKEVKIALVAIAGVVLLFFGLNFLKGLSIFSDGHAYKIAFANVNGLSGSCPIYADGYRVGTVTGISYDYDKQGNIIVTAEIASDLMGNTQVNLLLANNPRERVNPGETIMGAIAHGAVDDI